MPQLIAVAVAYALPATAATAITVAGTAVTYATLIGYAATIGGAMAYGASQNSKMKNAMKALQADQGRNVMVRDPIAAHRAIYGEVATSGPITYMATAGTKNDYLYLNVLLAAHECDTLGEISFEGPEVVPLDGSDEATGKYAGFCNIKKYNGTNTQAADAVLQAAFPGVWTSSHKGSGRAYLRTRLKHSPDLYPNGIPTITCKVKGRKVLDPRVGIYVKTCDMEAGNTHIGADTTSLSVGMRVIGQGVVPGTRIVSIDGSGTFFTVDTAPQVTNTTASLAMGVDAWSANAALCIADYMADTQFGKGIPWARINQTSLTEAANICDEDVVLDDTSTEKRYTINGTTDTNQSPDVVLQSMCAAMSGYLVDTGGVWHVRAGAYRTPEITLTDDDLVGAFTVNPRQSRRETFNGVRGTFISPLNQWSPADFPPVKNDTYMAEDGNVRLWKDVAYPWTTSSPTTQRLAKTDLERGRQQIICTGLYKLKSFKAMPGDTVRLTRAALGWTNKEFELIEWAFQVIPGSKGMTLGVQCTFRETASSIWDWNNGEETTTDPAPNTDLPDPTVVAVPTITLTADDTTALQQQDGTWIPRLKAAWPLPNDIYLEQGGKCRLEYKKTADIDWIFWSEVPVNQTFEFITDVQTEVSFDVRARFINQLGVRGAYSTTQTLTVPKKAANPGALTVTASALPEAIKLTIGLPSDTDIDGVDIYELGSSTPAPVDATTPTFKLGPDTVFERAGVTAGSTLYYWARTRSTTPGRRSAWVGPTSATAADGPVVALANASTAIASANNKNTNFYQSGTPSAIRAGDTWFKTGTDEIYNATAPGTGNWVLISIKAGMVSGQLTDAQIAAIAAAKLTGQITETQITNDAVSTPKIRAGAIETAQLAADSVVAAKIAAGEVTATHVSTNQIITTAANIADAVITNAKIVNLDAGKISAGNITVALVLTTGSLLSGSGTDNEVSLSGSGLRVGLTSGGSVQLSQYASGSAGLLLYNGSGTLKGFFVHHGGDTTLSGAGGGNDVIQSFQQVNVQEVHALSTSDSETTGASLTANGGLYVNGGAYFQGLTRFRGHMELYGTNRFKFLRDASGASYMDEDWGIRLNGDDTHPVKIAGAFCLQGCSFGGTSYTGGRIYLTDSIYLHVSGGELWLNDGNGDRALT